MAVSFDKGKFVISLDFELFWGVRDKRTIENYGANILGVQQVIPALLKAFDQHGVKGTFSTVGFLFARNRDELLMACPAIRPQYTDKVLSPYYDLNTLGYDEKEDPWHYGYSLVEMIRDNGRHELGTHTFCHYYCLEPGQTPEAFREDLQAARHIAEKMGIKVRSLVFPRNQFNEEYLVVCKESGIDSYRGNPESWLYSGRNRNDETLFRRAIRFADTYLNLTGHHCYTREYVLSSSLVNVAGSRFLRPCSTKLGFLERLRLRRIKKAMRHAARNRKLYHLWWHPHNFGVNLEANMRFLEEILEYYTLLNRQYEFESVTMSELTDELKQSR